MTAQEKLKRAETLLRDILAQDMLTDAMPDGNVYCTICEAEQPYELALSRDKRKRAREATHTGACIISKIQRYFVDASAPA